MKHYKKELNSFEVNDEKKNREISVSLNGGVMEVTVIERNTRDAHFISLSNSIAL